MRESADGAGLTARPLAHQNGQAPLLGAVGAGARVRGLNGDQPSLALRLGAVLILTPGYTNAVAGAAALNVAGGMSGFAGTLAPEQLGEKPSFLCALRAAQRFVDHREALRNPPGPAETFSQFSKK